MPVTPERRYCGAYSDVQIYARKDAPAKLVAIKRMRRTADVNDETDEDLLKFSRVMVSTSSRRGATLGLTQEGYGAREGNHRAHALPAR
ncbi:hypothetical protein AURDEDRAFT_111733 [Auricularia subglabra TFB-10046 SS5]|nr:hypothetical protein AURDEDRAFT_111733 [Auricularia subglabra TFB-10046 SS5]